MDTNNLIHNLDQKPVQSEFSYGKFFIFVGIAVILGTALGFGLTKLPKKGKSINLSSAQAEKTVGIVDKKTFKDKAEGSLKEGGIDGEGNFHLERPGGVSQNVYLTSTTVDLSQYIIFWSFWLEINGNLRPCFYIT